MPTWNQGARSFGSESGKPRASQGLREAAEKFNKNLENMPKETDSMREKMDRTREQQKELNRYLTFYNRALQALLIGAALWTALELAEFAINSDFKDSSGKTALHYAVLYGGDNAITLINYLIAIGANPMVGDNEGNTFLHYAVTSGNIAVVKAFTNNLSGKPNNYYWFAFHPKNHKGQTPADIARSENNTELIKYFDDLEINNQAILERSMSKLWRYLKGLF